MKQEQIVCKTILIDNLREKQKYVLFMFLNETPQKSTNELVHNWVCVYRLVCHSETDVNVCLVMDTGLNSVHTMKIHNV